MVAHADPRWQQLRLAFSAELDERVRDLNQWLLRLEQTTEDPTPRAEILHALFRDAHSLKGAARAVGLDAVEQLAHALESALDVTRQADALPAASWFDAAYRAVDALTPLYRAAVEGADADGLDLQAVLTGLDQATTPARTPQPAPRPPEAPVRLPATVDPPYSGPRAPPSATTAPASIVPRAPDIQSIGAPVGSVRVAIEKLDALLAAAGELAVAQLRVERRLAELHDLARHLDNWRRERRSARSLRTRLRRGMLGLGTHRDRRAVDAMLRFDERAEAHARGVLERVQAIAAHLRDDTSALALVTRTIEDEVLAVRVLPMGALFGPFERLVRDLTRAEGKEARLLLDGANIELDRKILEQIRDPLMHMLRNAIDHGVEAPDLRQARGKPRSGTIRLTAALRGGSVQIELADDGAGLDPLVLRQTAVRKGLLTPEQAAALDDAGLRDLIFRPGFSTSQVVTELSGRGVGMDVVRIQVEQLNGQVAVFSAPGEGTRFTLTVPLTLATTRALLVAIGHQLFAVPAALVERAARVRPAGLTCVEGWLTMQVDGQPVPVVELAELLGCGAEPPSLGSTEAWRWVFLLRQGARRLAILVDLLVGEQELVVKPLSWPLQRVRHVAGAAVLGSGQTALILNPLDLLKAGLRAPSRPPPAVPAVEGPTSDPAKANLRRRLLIVDDSLTTRTLVRSILEAAGYEVLVAADGVEALDLLRDRPIDLVVTDVDMPGLDGFGLTAEIRRDPALQRLPVVLVTSLEAREHRERGVKVGADAYIVKRGFDQAQLLDTIRRLL